MREYKFSSWVDRACSMHLMHETFWIKGESCIGSAVMIQTCCLWYHDFMVLFLGSEATQEFIYHEDVPYLVSTRMESLDLGWLSFFCGERSLYPCRGGSISA